MRLVRWLVVRMHALWSYVDYRRRRHAANSRAKRDDSNLYPFY